MTNVIPLKPKADPMIWTCGECGCQTFYLYNDDSTECALCGCHDTQPRGRWLETLKDDETVPEDIPLRTNVVHASAEFARKSTLKSVGEDTVMIAILQRDGRIKAWSEVSQESTPEQQEWLRHTMTAATALTLGETASTDDYPE